ncbi:MAG: NAD(P)H-hydrate dehydratase, partial [Brevundimonas sp.]
MNPINDPMTWQSLLPWPGAEAHKHARGRLGVVSGGALSTGAARLAARAGLRVGAGLVKVFCPPDAAPVLAPALEAVMLASFVSGPGSTTLPMEVFSAVRLGVKPEINAVASLILLAVSIVTFLVWFFSRRAE